MARNVIPACTAARPCRTIRCCFRQRNNSWPGLQPVRSESMSLIRLIFGFDPWLYQREMSRLVDEACARFQALPGSPVLYTANIWTDPDAACSAVNIDTWENSQVEV